MFRSLTIAATTCALMFALSVAPASAAAKGTRAKEHSLAGTLEKVDGQTLTVKTPAGAQSVMLSPSTHITQNGKAIQAAQLSSDTGSRVKVRYTESNGEKQARMITVASTAKVAKK
jgi:hypothetical protein